MEAAFIQAIRDEPDDDLPRLAYADWLEEHGRTERAELIRVQCELTRGVRDRDRSVELRCRLRALVVLHLEEWRGDLARWARDAIFERGFIERISLPAATFLAHAGDILAVHPVHHVQLSEAAAVIRALAGCPALTQLRSLDLRDNFLRDAGAVALAGSPHLERLVSLVLTGAGIGAAGAQALAAAGLQGLEALLLAGNSLGDDGVAALAGTLHLQRLTRLDLSRNGITDVGATVLAAAGDLTRLRSLRLAYNDLTRQGAEALAHSPRLAGVTVLDVSGNSGIDRQAGAELRRRFGVRLLA